MLTICIQVLFDLSSSDFYSCGVATYFYFFSFFNTVFVVHAYEVLPYSRSCLTLFYLLLVLFVWNNVL